MKAKASAPTKPLLDLEAWRASRVFVGAAKPREYLVEDVFPMGQASLIAASGGVGKSFSCLALCADVAGNTSDNLPRHFGGALVRSGQAVYVSAEDDKIEIHSRLDAIGLKPERLITVPLPSAGGAVPFFSLDPRTRTPMGTKAWEDLKRQFAQLEDLAMITLDPLQPLCTLDLNQPENAQFVCSQLSALAAETRAAVIVTHHFAKKEAATPDEARQAIRGTAGLVDGVRAAYVLWFPTKKESKEICKTLGLAHAPGKVVNGAVVKANGRASHIISTFIREDNGFLRDRTEEIRLGRPGKPVENLEALLVKAIAEAARQGKPYSKTGENGLYMRRSGLPEPFSTYGRQALEDFAQELLNAKRLLKAAPAKGSKNIQWLDEPNGRFALGQGELMKDG